MTGTGRAVLGRELTSGAHIHRHQIDQLLAPPDWLPLGVHIRTPAEVTLDGNFEVVCKLLGENLQELEQGAGHRRVPAKLLNHRRRRVRPQRVGNLECEVGEGDAELGEDYSRPGGERAQSGEEGVAQREQLRFGE